MVLKSSVTLKVPQTLAERDAIIREIVGKALKDAFTAGWVAGQFSVMTPEAIANACELLNEHECEQAWRLYNGDSE